MNQKKIFASILLVSFATAVLAQEGVKVGIVDADLVVQSSIKGKRFFQEYESFGKERAEEIQSKITAFRDQEKDFQTKVNSLSEDKKKELLVHLQNLETDIKRLQEDAKRETDRRLNDALDRFRKELAPIIRQVAEEKGLDIIFNHGPGSNLVYFSEKVNITDAVVQKYDETVEE